MKSKKEQSTDQGDRINLLLEKMRQRAQVDEQKYKGVLQNSSYFGHLDGQKRMINSLKRSFAGNIDVNRHNFAPSLH